MGFLVLYFILGFMFAVVMRVAFGHLPAETWIGVTLFWPVVLVRIVWEDIIL